MEAELLIHIQCPLKVAFDKVFSDTNWEGLTINLNQSLFARTENNTLRVFSCFI